MPRIVCISNRVSLPDPKTGEIKAGGLTVGVKAALENHGGGLWFGWDGTILSPQQRRCLNKTVKDNLCLLTMSLTREEYEGYYKGMANENLWPLMHGLGCYIGGRMEYFSIYKRVNQVFACMIKPHLLPDDIIWVHDYHLISLGRELRALGVRNAIGYFHHIPVPSKYFIESPDVPAFLKFQYRVLLEDFFYYDLVGFQSFRDFKNFNESLPFPGHYPRRYHSVPLWYQGKRAHFGVFPISIETGALIQKSWQGSRKIVFPKQKYDNKIVIGAERLDYTKGLVYRLQGFSKFLEQHSEYHKKIQYYQITPLTRSDIPQYQHTIAETRKAVDVIKSKFGAPDWEPITYSETCIARDHLIAGFRQAHVGLVTPLIDGQNLVAKEYLAAQSATDPGVLVLSNLAGAAEELKDFGVLCVNPYDTGDIAEKLYQALQMPLARRIESHQRVIAHLYHYDITHWAESFLEQISEIKMEKEISYAAMPYSGFSNILHRH